MPDIVLVTGGYVCAPVILAARLLRKPVVVYLPDVTPGLAVRLLSRFAARVAVTCHEAARYFQSKAVVTGYPTRAAVTKATSDSAAAKAALGLEDGRKTVLVFGGSRGAVSINRALQAGLPELLSVSQVLHITGTLDWPWVSKVRDGLPPVLRQHYHPFSYLHEEMALALAAADLAVSRAGAATLGEYTAAGLPSVLVPYPHAGRHQDANARYLARHGAAEVLDDSELLERLLPTILRLLNDDRKLQRMGEMALTLAEPCAAQRLAALLRAVAQGRTPAQASSGG